VPTSVTYRERLTPPWWAWLLAGGWAATIGVAYGYAINAGVGLAVGCAGLGLASLGLWQMSAVVEVDETGLRAGRAVLPLWAWGAVAALDRDEARRLRGTGADPMAFVLLRGWVATAVTIEVDDDADPTPYWFVSSRRPERLADALRAAASGDPSGGPDVTRSGRSSRRDADER
jgi:hypothetical protein